MELPFHLKTLEPLPGALEIIRFFDEIDSPTADMDEICDGLDLSERRFSKAIRRLVTKGYVQMDGDLVYRLTDQGQRAVEELRAYDEAIGASSGVSVQELETQQAEQIARRLVLAAPEQLVAGQPAQVVVGFNPAANGAEMAAEVVVRASILNAQPESEDLLFSLTGDAAHQAMQFVPAPYDAVRIRLEVFQLGDNPGDIDAAGGMYVDLPVLGAVGDAAALTAYGVDVSLAV